METEEYRPDPHKTYKVKGEKGFIYKTETELWEEWLQTPYWMKYQNVLPRGFKAYCELREIFISNYAKEKWSKL